MKLSKTSAHAALALAFLAGRDDGGPTQARQVAEHLGIPTDSALKILQTLARNRLIQSQLGRAGGYRFHRLASEISLVEVVEATDGPIAAHMPVPSPQQRDLAPGLGLLETACERAAEGLRDTLGGYTVADLAQLDETAPV